MVIYQETEENTNRGVEYMLQAAERGDRHAMVYMAKAYETGMGLGTKRWAAQRKLPHVLHDCCFII